MKMTAATVQELRRILDAFPADAAVSFAGEAGLAVFVQSDASGKVTVSIDSQCFDMDG